jgi:soluble lytic murein transglycosylase
VTPGASTRKSRSKYQTSGKRSHARRRVAATRRRKMSRVRRAVVIGISLLVGLAVGYGVANRDELGQTILEVTLPLRHDDIIRQQAEEKGVPADLIAAVIHVESKFRDQTSHAGARGLMQITPSTATEIEKLSGGETFESDDLADPDINIRYGTFYLDYLLDLYDDNEVAAIAAYNAGPTAVAQWGGAETELEAIGFQETRDYVENVLDKREEYRDHYPDALGLD